MWHPAPQGPWDLGCGPTVLAFSGSGAPVFLSCPAQLGSSEDPSGHSHTPQAALSGAEHPYLPSRLQDPHPRTSGAHKEKALQGLGRGFEGLARQMSPGSLQRRPGLCAGWTPREQDSAAGQVCAPSLASRGLACAQGRHSALQQTGQHAHGGALDLSRRCVIPGLCLHLVGTWHMKL